MIEYIDETHTYLINGVIATCVSDLVRFATGNTYANIPQDVLERAAIFGTAIHKAVEDYENYGFYQVDEEQSKVFDKYLDLKEQYNFEVLDQEVLVHYNTSYCGRFDGLLLKDEVLYLYDIKTTSKCNVEALQWQLGLYKLAYETMTQETIDKCSVIWLPKRQKAKFMEIEPKTKEEIEVLLSEFSIASR